MITLGIETSCDETAVCILETENNSYKILGNLINSQVDLHRQYGGVFPIMAKREHAKNLIPLLEKLIDESGIEQIKITDTNTDAIASAIDRKNIITEILKAKEPELLEHLLASKWLNKKPAIDQIAVTRGPGLEPALWVGVNCARALSEIWVVPLVGVNHMEGHVVGSLLDSVIIEKIGQLKSGKSAPTSKTPLTPLRPLTLPALSLLISGGHTELVLVKKIGEYEVIGRTKDDAVGEAYDKVARMLGLPYPGGPFIHELAEKAREKNARKEKSKAEMPHNHLSEKTGSVKKMNTRSEPSITLPRPMIHSKDLDFSFSGIKTAVLYLLRNLTEAKQVIPKEEIALEFENAITEVLIAKTEKALEEYEANTIIIGGGVIANPYIREAFATLAHKYSIPLYLPPAGVSGDNALMIALAGALNTGSPSTTAGSQTGQPAQMRAHGNLSL
jgi:N6-L-threonylcarbamoyladenine synthase